MTDVQNENAPVVGGVNANQGTSATPDNTVPNGTAQENPRLSWALYMLNKGYPVMRLYGVTDDGACTCMAGPACKYKGKHPDEGSGGVNNATTDPAVITQRLNEKPFANYGYLNGVVTDTFDPDMKKGKDGIASMAALGITHDDLGEYMVTPSGGEHWPFQPDGIRELGTFTDRGEHRGLDYTAMLVGPGSVTELGYYTLENQGATPKPMPLALLAFAQKHAAKTNDSGEDTPPPDPIDNLPALLAKLGMHQGHVNYLLHGDAAWKNNDRSTAIFTVASAMGHKGIDAQTAYSILCASDHAMQCAMEHWGDGRGEAYLYRSASKACKTVDATKADQVAQLSSAITKPGMGAADVPLEEHEVRRMFCLLENWEYPKLTPAVDELIFSMHRFLFFGDPEAGKSLLLQNLLLHIANGEDAWMGRPIHIEGPVIILMAEGQASIKERLEMMAQAHFGKPATALKHPVVLTYYGLDLDTEGGRNELFEQLDDLDAQLIDWYGRKGLEPVAPVMSVIDTMRANMAGSDKNDDDSEKFFRTSADIGKRYSCPSGVVHHSGHTEKERSRGSSNIKATLDMEWMVEKDDDVIKLKCTKWRDGDKTTILVTAFRLEEVEVEGFEGGGLLLKTIHGAELKEKAAEKKLSANADKAVVGLQMALLSHGMRPTPEMLADMRHDGCVDLPNAGQMVVTIGQWRGAAVKEGLGEKCTSEQARKNAWKNARAELEAAGKAVQSAKKKEAWCWAVEKQADFHVINGGEPVEQVVQTPDYLS